MAVPYRVCFVCTGNICRSPIAEVVARRQLQEAGLADRVTVDSAGTGGWHIGEQADPRAREVLTGHGYDGELHRARQWRRGWWDEHDLVLALDSTHLDSLGPRAVLLRSYDPAADGDLEVADPYFGGPDGFDVVLGQIEAACAGLVARLGAMLEP